MKSPKKHRKIERIRISAASNENIFVILLAIFSTPTVLIVMSTPKEGKNNGHHS